MAVQSFIGACFGSVAISDVVTHPSMASGRRMSPRRTSCLHCLSAKRANTAISCVTVKSPLWLHYLDQSAPGHCSAKQDSSICWLACSSMALSGSRFLHHHTQGEQRRNRHQLRVTERGGRQHGHHPFDTCRAKFRAECLFYYIIVRKNSWPFIIKIILDSLFSCIQWLPFPIEIFTILLSPHYDIKWFLNNKAVQRVGTHASRWSASLWI